MTLDSLAPIVIQKQGYEIEISAELLRDSSFMSSDTWDLMLGLREPTAKEIASSKRHAAKRARLRAAGLLDDNGREIKATECPACLTVADSTAAGWSGPLGDDVRCELKRGHKGPHKYVVVWDESN